MVLISVFLCLLLLVFNVFPYNDLFLLPVFLEPAVFFLFLVTYYFCFDWDETIYRTYLGLGLIVQISFKKQVFFPIILVRVVTLRLILESKQKQQNCLG